MVDKSCWKCLHIFAYFTAFFGCIVAAATVGNLVRAFEGLCPIYADINVTLNSISANDSKLWIEVREMRHGVSQEWGPESSCNFAIYANVLGAVYAFIFLYFVILMEKGNPEKSEDITSLLKESKVVQQHQCSLVIPSLILCTVFTCTLIAVSVEIQNGLHFFCHSLHKGTGLSCSQLAFIPWVHYPNGDEFYYLLLAAQVGTWVGTGGYVISLLLYTSNCCFARHDVEVRPKKKIVRMKSPKKFETQHSLNTATTSVEED